MAFQQPVARPARRAVAPPPIETTAKKPDPEPIADSQEWVLFSPDQRRTDAASASDSLQTPRTANKSRLDSDFDSLDTKAVFDRDADGQRVDIEDDDATEDLDSLDDGLHAFNEPPESPGDVNLYNSTADAILPAHDGLGAFPGSSSPVQEQFWRHERANPQRRRRSIHKPSSLAKQLDALQHHEGHQPVAKDERFQRIEKWRMDQSRAIMEEIERESRRLRKRGRASVSSSTVLAEPVEEAPREHTLEIPIRQEQQEPAQTESFWTRLTRSVMRDLMGFDTATLTYIFGDDASVLARATQEEEMMREAERIARDEAVAAEQAAADCWEERLLARIARELGTFVNEVCEHPGAFSSFLRAREAASDIPYAGLPTPPELRRPDPLAQRRRARHQQARRRHSIAKTDPSLFGIEEEEIEPTHDSAAAALAGNASQTAAAAAAIVDAGHDQEDEEANDLTPQATRHIAADDAYAASLVRERAYWERDLDVKMVFGYLCERLSGSPPDNDDDYSGLLSTRPPNHSSQSPVSASSFLPPPSSTGRFANASTSTSDSLRRAALIRHHHPLVSKRFASASTTTASLAASASAAAAAAALALEPPATSAHADNVPPAVTSPLLSPILGRRPSSSVHDGADGDGASSCASQSTKKSKTRHSASGGGGPGSVISLGGSSSRNYWDLGGPAWGEA